jgi:ADP-ribose pyrophosphatase YjhB (NUDIX family)
MKTREIPKRVEGNTFTVVLLGIVFDTKKRKILIGRREKDPYVQNLTWAFPGGRAVHGEELELTLKNKIKEETGYEVESLGSVFSRIHPDKIGEKNLMCIYYLCEIVKGREKPLGDIVEIKWVSPEELEKYFTTSFHPHLKEYVLNLK